MVIKDDQGSERMELISNGERRLKLLSEMKVDVVTSPYIDKVLNYLLNDPKLYGEAKTSFDSQEHTLNKILTAIEYLKALR